MTMPVHRLRGVILVCLALAAGATAALVACGPFLTDLVTVTSIGPADPAGYARGQVGVVRPRFARKYLVQAYRRLSDKPPLGTVLEASGSTRPGDPDEWFRLRDAVLTKPPDTTPARGRRFDPSRRTANYQSFENCNADALGQAAATLKSRMARWGSASPAVVDWTQAQVAVFENCAGSTLVLPEPVPAGADLLLRADREYQTAAACFYGTAYEEAGRRFRAIAGDSSSPWRIYGRYLAARAAIRQATVLTDTVATAAPLFARAETDLNAVLADPAAARLHASARGLLGFVAYRSRPVERLHELSRVLASADAVDEQALVDFRHLMDKFVGDTVDYEYGSIARIDDLRSNDDLIDWILAMQGSGEAALDRAVGRWNATRATPWLVAVLWKLPPSHPESATALAAAERIERSSPAFDTVLFLRVRLLAGQGRRDEARSLLNDVPLPGAISAETQNLFSAERFMLAKTLEDLLSSAPRTIVVSAEDSWMYGALRRARSAKGAFGTPTFDEDAAAVFTTRLPLELLVAAAESDRLPDRLRTRVAAAAFTRAWLFGREDAAVAVVPHLRRLAPQLATDLDRYAAAAAGTVRHLAGLLLLLRTPGMHTYVRGIDDEVSYQAADPLRTFDHTFSRNWWCGIERASEDGIYASAPSSAVRELLYGKGEVPFPEFLTTAEREEVQRELNAMAALGPAPQYLAGEALKWVRGRPKDVDVAEALAQVVEGWRWTCPGATRDPQLARRSFETLHRLFPQSEWAKRTRYWYP
jgi:hypothetical protein